MNGEKQRDMDDAWLAYVYEREELKKTGVGYGWNPKKIFEAGWAAGETRSSGWYSGRE